ncbi:hypothetical protein SLEP1_g37422 [Rubroshorea leprosula]|uniref:Uncharacterized protein n=1 Tax=Rubroshorea leprosula TaxID=152421 RepID=A0AAV5KUU4_9ROSI|nr:hypothetical protein SLEP1_g37422 [Rubroshorea leprosula]
MKNKQNVPHSVAKWPPPCKGPCGVIPAGWDWLGQTLTADRAVFIAAAVPAMLPVNATPPYLK